MAKRLLGYYANSYYATQSNGTNGIAFPDRDQWIYINEEDGTAQAVSLAEIVLAGQVSLVG